MVIESQLEESPGSSPHLGEAEEAAIQSFLGRLPPHCVTLERALDEWR